MTICTPIPRKYSVAWGTLCSETTKMLLVGSGQNVPRSKEYFRGMGVQVVTGSRYLGGFIEERETEAQWITAKVEG